MSVLASNRPGAGVVVTQVKAIRPNYVPGTNLPTGEVLLTFEDVSPHEDGTKYSSTEKTHGGTTVYGANFNGKEWPFGGYMTWKAVIADREPVVDVPSKDDPTQYFRMIVVDLVRPVTPDGNPVNMKTFEKKKAEWHAAKQAIENLEQPKPIVAKTKSVKHRRINGVSFLQLQDGSFTWSMPCANSNVEHFMLKLDPGQQVQTFKLNNSNERRTVPINVEVIEQTAAAPQMLSFLVRLVPQTPQS